MDAQRPELRVEYRAPADLKPDEKNARTHSAEQVKELRAGFEEFGFTNPILIDEADAIIAGHGRRLAALLPPALVRVPTIRLVGLDAKQKRALRIADNKLGLNSGWDLEILRGELIELADSGFSMDLTGFSPVELQDIISPSANSSGALAQRFGIPPFTILNAREGWWQERKAAWLALGIQSELGRGEQSSPGGSPRPAADYSDKRRGDGRGRRANAIPGGAPMPLDRAKGAPRA